MKEQRKIITCLLAILYVFGLSACSSEKEFKPDYESAVGVIVVNDTEEIAASSKNYAAFENNRFTFDLDAAAVYYFDVDEEVSYAGDQNLSSLQFGANVDDETVAAVGTVTYKSGAQGTASAYYLYHDESGLYFDPGDAFQQIEFKDQVTIEGSDYSCVLTFSAGEPATSVKLKYYDGNNQKISAKDYSISDIADYQKFELEDQVSSVEIECCGADGAELETRILTKEESNTTLVYSDGGQFLGAKTLLFVWDQ
ncbi:MAG: hypothetical protein ACLSHA_12060 [Neglectibacter timonensis]